MMSMTMTMTNDDDDADADDHDDGDDGDENGNDGDNDGERVNSSDPHRGKSTEVWLTIVPSHLLRPPPIFSASDSDSDL